MDSLPKIPSPPAHHWREFRIKVMPVLVFVAALSAVIVLWNDHLGAPTATGEVEIVKADIKSEKVGTLTNLTVVRFQTVTKGQVLATLITAGDDALNAAASVIEADLKLMRARMDQDQVRNELNYELLRMEPLKEWVMLATTEVKLREAESEFQRVQKLYQDNIIPASEFDAAKNLKDALAEEVKYRKQLVNNLEIAVRERRLDKGNTALTASNNGSSSSDKDAVEAAIAAQEEKLRVMREPVVLRAPMDGIVSFVFHRDGERILAGEPIVTVTSTKPQHVVGYLRQPRPFDPMPGMSVTIRTRGVVRHELHSVIVAPTDDETLVGPPQAPPVAMQRVTSPMRGRLYDSSMERGVPFLVALPSSLPAGMKLHPGEVVDLIIRPDRGF